MKTLRFLLALALLATVPSAVRAVDPDNSRSTSRYLVLPFKFSTTANITGEIVSAVPRGMTLKDVQIAQNGAGVGGTSWVATPKRNGVAMTSTNGGFTLAAGASKSTNATSSPLGAFTNPTGGTRPVIAGPASASGTVTVQAALANNETTAICGQTYTAKTSGATGLLEFNIGVDESADCTALAALVNANPSSPCTATCASAVGTVKAKNVGAAGNALGLTETGSGFVVSGANLTGGRDLKSSAGDIITMDVTLTGTYSGAVSGSVTLYLEPSF